jgi:hypothetical protein
MKFAGLYNLERIDIANTEYRYTAIRIPVNTGIPVFLTGFFKPNWTADRREKSSSFDKILMQLLVQMSQDSYYQAMLTVLSGNY